MPTSGKNKDGRRPRALNDWALSAGFPHFRHRRQRIIFGFAKKRHPQVVVGHRCSQRRLLLELHSICSQSLAGRLQVLNVVLEDRGWMVEFGLLRRREHQAYATATEKAQPWACIEQMTHAQHIAAKSDSTWQVLDIDGDL